MNESLFIRLTYIFLKTDSVLLPLISSLIFIGWFVILIIPVSTFDSSPTYNVLASLLDERICAVLMGFLGLVQIFVTVVNIHWRKQAWVNFACGFAWIFISTMTIIANPVSTGAIVYPVLSALCGGRFYRCYQDKDRV